MTPVLISMYTHFTTTLKPYSWVQLALTPPYMQHKCIQHSMMDVHGKKPQLCIEPYKAMCWVVIIFQGHESWMQAKVINLK